MAKDNKSDGIQKMAIQKINLSEYDDPFPVVNPL